MSGHESRTSSKPLQRRIGLLLFLAFLLTALSPVGLCAGQTLTILTWSDYLDPRLIERFERESNATVKLVYFETDDMRDEMLIETEAAGYDIVLITGFDAAKYVRRGWLAQVDTSQVPNLKHIDARWRAAFPKVKAYAVPYFWGTTGIAYRSDLVNEPITSWRQLYQPAEALRGKIVMIKTGRDVIGMALKALGYSANSDDPTQLREVEQMLLAQKPFVRSYSYVSVGEDSTLVSGETTVAMIYSGDALVLKEYAPALEYVVPEEGTNVWVDYLAVTSSSSHKALAWQFINFLNEPENAAQLAQFVWYASPNSAAKGLLPDDFLDNPVIYPPLDVFERSQTYTELPPRAVRTRNEIFSRIVE